MTDWTAVPPRVQTLLKLAAEPVAAIRAAIQDLPAMSGYGYVYWQPDTNTAHVVLGDSDEQEVYDQWRTALEKIPAVQQIEMQSEVGPADRENWLLVKRANALGLSFNPFYKQAITSPNALATTLAGGLLGGGLGYGAGTLIEHLFPERYVQRGRLRKTLGLLGAGVGTMPGLWAASARGRMAPPRFPGEARKPLGFLGGLLTPTGDLPYDPDLQAEMRNQQLRDGVFDKAGAQLAAVPLDPWFQKSSAANFGFTASGDLPPVPLDAFGQAIWNDVRNYHGAQNNRYGTKSPWGTNDQPMYTPPAVGAAAAGIVSGIGQQYGNPASLSPVHFMRGLATAGVDLATARVAGGILGALGGLTPAAQTQLQQAGLWGGLIRGVVGSVLGQ